MQPNGVALILSYGCFSKWANSHHPHRARITIAGTRITLYDVMDYVVANYPSSFIRALFDLAESQIKAALSYIEANRAEIEAEYQLVLTQAEELKQYYEEQNRERMAQIETLPPPPGLEAAWKKLQAAKARHQSQT